MQTLIEQQVSERGGVVDPLSVSPESSWNIFSQCHSHGQKLVPYLECQE